MSSKSALCYNVSNLIMYESVHQRSLKCP